LDGVSLTDIPAGAEVWEKVIRKLRAGMMPPAGVPRPDQAALDRLVTHLETTLDRAAVASPVLRGPTMHRLNRAEYGNAIRDLLSLQVDVSSLLPRTRRPSGSTTMPACSTCPPRSWTGYLSAAWKISAQAVASPAITPSLETFRVRGDLSQHDHVAGLPMGTRGGILIRHYFPVDGEYVDQSPSLSRDGQHHPRPRAGHDLEITLDGERVVLARFGGPRTNRRTICSRRSPATRWRSAFRSASESAAGTARSGVSLHQEELGDNARTAAAVRARANRPDHASRHPELDKVTIEGPFNVVAQRHVPEPQARSSPCRPTSDR
jgi:hypothetical protein